MKFLTPLKIRVSFAQDSIESGCFGLFTSNEIYLCSISLHLRNRIANLCAFEEELSRIGVPFLSCRVDYRVKSVRDVFDSMRSVSSMGKGFFLYQMCEDTVLMHRSPCYR